MPITAKVPEPFVPLFDKAEHYIKDLFSEFRHEPSHGTIHVGDRRYVLLRGESLFMALFEQFSAAFGEEQANEFIYNMARVIGRSDSERFCQDRGVKDPTERLSAGPIHFAYSGWARVEIHDTSNPTPDENYFLHYTHPNTFETEAIMGQGKQAEHPICFFSAGYSAGWCSVAYGIEVHAREIKCLAAGDERCEFIMAPFDKLDHYEAKLK